MQDNEIDALRARFAREVEDAKRVMSFATSDEWQWFRNHVMQPTVDEYTERILKGLLPEREDMHIRGMIQGIRLVIDTVETFMENGDKAKDRAKQLEEDIKNAD